MPSKAVVLAVVASLVAGPAMAATVSVKSGEVFIDRGKGYTPVSGSTQGKPGDTVMVLAGGTGEIVYSDGCRQPVEVGSVVTISEASPCGTLNTGYGDSTLVIGGLVIAGGVAAAIAFSGGDSDKPASK